MKTWGLKMSDYRPDTSRPLDDAERDVLRAQAARIAAEERKLAAEAEEAEHKAAVAAIARQKEEEKRERDRAADDFEHRVYTFGTMVSPDSVNACIKTLKQWHRLAPECDIEIIFSSPGGYVHEGMELFDYIHFLRRANHKVTTSAAGYAASMAGILVQAGDVRTIGREAYLMIHEVSFGAGGKTSDIEDEVAFAKKIQDRVLDIFHTRCQETGRPKALTARKIKSRWHRRDWWLDSQEAFELGLVDEVR